MSLGRKGPLGIPGSGGGANITPIPVVAAVGSSTATIQWPAVPSAISYEVFSGPTAEGPWTSEGTTSDESFEITGMSAETETWAHVFATVVSPAGVVSFVTAEVTSPTIPGRKRILGRTSNWSGNMFDNGQNDAGWWGYAAATPAVTGPTNITIRHRFKNQTGKAITKLAIPFFGVVANPANLLALWVGVPGEGTAGSAWQRMTFGGQNTSQLAAGTTLLPSYAVSDTITLTSPWLPDAEIMICVVYEDDNQISIFDSLGTLSNNESEMSLGWVGVGDAGSTLALLDATVTWYGNWQAPYCHLFVEFAGTESTEVSVLAYGDSVINQYRIYNDPDNTQSRDGYSWELEKLNTENTWHLAPAGNGGLTVSQFCDRLISHLPVYTPWVDVVAVEGWSANGAPVNAGEAAAYKAKISATSVAVEAAGRGFATIFLVPPAGVIDGAENFPAQGTPAKTWFDDAVSWAGTTFPNRVIDARSGVWDPLDHDRFLAGNSHDEIHMNRVGGIASAPAIKVAGEAVLTGFGYTV